MGSKRKRQAEDTLQVEKTALEHETPAAGKSVEKKKKRSKEKRHASTSDASASSDSGRSDQHSQSDSCDAGVQQEEMKSKDGAAKKKSKKEKKEKSDKDAKKKKKKKEKKEKGKDKDGESSKASVESQRSEEAPVEARESASSAGGSSWNDWSQADFSGDAARKDKFMRLLGAKKAPAGGSTARKGLYGSLQAGTSGTAINSNVAQQMEQHMEQQFAAGIRARKDRFHGGPSGLGFGS